MLIQFTVENFLSFNSKVVFSMLASDDQRHPEQVCTLPDGRRLVRCATLYGANASGKSNLVKALRFARNLVAEGTRPGNRISVKPFKLPLDTSKESHFEFEIWAEGHRYSYGFAVTAKEVCSEWLYRTDGETEHMCFERETTQGGKENPQIKLGDIFGDERARVDFVAKGTRPEQLFLTEAAEQNIEELKPLSVWFRDRLRVIAPEADLSSVIFHSKAEEPQPPVFVIDEIARGLHPLLTRRLLQDYLQMNDPVGQIIMTTHNTNLQDLDLLRADQIWFMEKDAAQASQLYSLAEFKPEQLQQLGSRLEKGYMSGRFGAVPFFGRSKQLSLTGT